MPPIYNCLFIFKYFLSIVHSPRFFEINDKVQDLQLRIAAAYGYVFMTAVSISSVDSLKKYKD